MKKSIWILRIGRCITFFMKRHFKRKRRNYSSRKNDKFSMSQVAQIVESNNAKILGLFISNQLWETKWKLL